MTESTFLGSKYIGHTFSLKIFVERGLIKSPSRRIGPEVPNSVYEARTLTTRQPLLNMSFSKGI